MSLKCRFCNNDLKHIFIDLGCSPIANNYLSENELASPEPFYNLCVYICEQCLLVQLPQTINPESIFDKEYAYFSSYSSSWVQHAKNYVETIAKKRITRECGINATYSNKDGTNYYCNKCCKTKNERIAALPDPNAFSLSNVENLIKSLNDLYENVLIAPYDIGNKKNNLHASSINVIIENQPPKLTQTMKSYSLIIYGFFANKKIQSPNIVNDIRFINAGTKTSDDFILEINKKLSIDIDLFKIYKKKYIEDYDAKFSIRKKKNEKLKYKKPDNYDIRKDFSVKLVTRFISTVDDDSSNIIHKNCSNIISSTKFELSKKKDDMADTLLYIYHAIYIGVLGT